MMESEECFIGPVNIGNPEEYTIKEIAEKIQQISGTKSKLVYRLLPKDDSTQRRHNNGLAKEKLGWQPTVSAIDGLAKTVAYFQLIV